ncbi:MAG: DUF2628 domain-containing protein [Planctomycetes bacterium]|nr:DUF2628 domain-containing protein [Planctomycetota bacterium]
MSALETNRPEDNPFAAPRSLEQAEVTVEGNDPQQTELIAFVGRNAKYFLPRWERTQGNYGFNWAAFFLGPLWTAYRKMYRVTAIYLGIVVLLTVAELVVFDVILKEEMPRAVDRVITIGLAIGCGYLANSLYLKHARRAIDRAHRVEPEPVARLALLRRRGGTSWLAVFLLLVLMIGLFALVVGVLIGMEPTVLGGVESVTR